MESLFLLYLLNFIPSLNILEKAIYSYFHICLVAIIYVKKIIFDNSI